MKQPLTSKQQEIYSFLRQYIKKEEDSPTLDEIRVFLDVSSLNTVVDHLKALEQKGYIVRRKHAKRNIELRDTDQSRLIDWPVTIPVIASVGCDDLSTFANDQEHAYDESIDVDRKLVSGKGDVVAVRAVGNSMNDAGIQNGDYILVELTQNAESGDRVAAIVGDMVTVKKLDKRNGMIILRPESTDPKYKPIIMSEDFKIEGKVICAIPGDSNMDITEVVYDQNIR
jgi:repressor LexA